MIKLVKDIRVVEAFACHLSMDDEKASFSRLRTSGAVKALLEKAQASPTNRIYGYYQEGVLIGLMNYFWIEEDRYCQTKLFLIDRDYDRVADAFIQKIKEDLPGYELYIGIPNTNHKAKTYFDNEACYLSEACIVTKLKQIQARKTCLDQGILRIHEDNFPSYESFHDRFALANEMYWTSQRLKEDLDRFRILAYRNQKEIIASIFYKIVGSSSEIFGVFVDEDHQDQGLERLMLENMNTQLRTEDPQVEAVDYFIEPASEAELTAAKAMGYETMDHYLSYKYQL